MNNQIPEGCYAKTDLARALKIGTMRIQNLAKEDDFPSPAGYFQSTSASKRTLPYWNLQEVKDWMDGCYVEVRAPRVKKPFQHLENQTAWAVPAHTDEEREQCLMHRNLTNIMRVNHEQRAA